MIPSEEVSTTFEQVHPVQIIADPIQDQENIWTLGFSCATPDVGIAFTLDNSSVVGFNIQASL